MAEDIGLIARLVGDAAGLVVLAGEYEGAQPGAATSAQLPRLAQS